MKQLLTANGLPLVPVAEDGTSVAENLYYTSILR
jgi:hypothetical protein